MSNDNNVPEGVILGMGNPLLDISAVVKPEMLTKYNLKENDAILYEKDDIYEELQRDYKVEYIAGGATQNSMRVAQWILGKPKAAAYFGCIGRGESGKKLESVAQGAGVDVKYQKDEKHPTGKCAVLITGHHRSLVTKLDAANHFTTAHLDDEDNWKMVEKAKIFYSSGFFLTVSVDSMVRVAKHAVLNGKVYSMNLAAPFLSEFFSENMMKVLNYTELVFGNETEAAAFAKMKKWSDTSAAGVAKRLATDVPFEGPSGRARTVVITQGADDVVVVTGNEEAKTFKVTKMAKEEIVDTNGAGDAFVGGYLAQMALGADLATRVRCGNWAAQVIIRRSGCTVPDEMDFK